MYRWRANSGQCRGDGTRSSGPPAGSRRRFPAFATDEPSARTTACVHPSHLQAPAAVSRHSRRTNRTQAPLRPTLRLRRRDPAMGCASLDSRAAATPTATATATAAAAAAATATATAAAAAALPPGASISPTPQSTVAVPELEPGTVVPTGTFIGDDHISGDVEVSRRSVPSNFGCSTSARNTRARRPCAGLRSRWNHTRDATP
ncbi:MAG: hypothetical protein JWP90_298 [Mycetocola sp.]|nr:hypothetical protein [Mycetocola sp.]